MTVYYIDVLFFINAAADYFILLASAKLSGSCVKRIRLFISCLFGGLYSVLTLPFPLLSQLPFKALCAFIMLYISFGISGRFLYQAFSFFAAAAFLGGIVYMLTGGKVSAPGLLIIIASAAYTASALFKNRVKAKKEEKKICIYFAGKSLCLTAAVDTGNTLKDPLTGKSAVIAGFDVLSPILPAFISGASPPEAMELIAKTKLAGSFRLLPYSAVGSKGLILAFKPDRVTVNDGESDCLIAISPTPVSCDGCSALAGL